MPTLTPFQTDRISQSHWVSLVVSSRGELPMSGPDLMNQPGYRPHVPFEQFEPIAWNRRPGSSGAEPQTAHPADIEPNTEDQSWWMPCQRIPGSHYTAVGFCPVWSPVRLKVRQSICSLRTGGPEKAPARASLNQLYSTCFDLPRERRTTTCRITQYEPTLDTAAVDLPTQQIHKCKFFYMYQQHIPMNQSTR